MTRQLSAPTLTHNVGEAGAVGAFPAVMIAILNALTPLGVHEFAMAPVIRGLSSSAKMVISDASGPGRTSQNSRKNGNSSPDETAVSTAKPRAETQKTRSMETDEQSLGPKHKLNYSG